MPSSPTETVQAIYAEFARGDVAALVARFHPEAMVVIHAPDSVPYGGTRRGPDAIGRWFVELGSTMALDRVEAETLIASGNEVAVRGVESGRSVATGRPYSSGFAHIWRLEDGLVTRLDDFMDSAAVTAAIAR